VSFSFARTTKRFPSSRWRFLTTKQCNELRGARIYGDLPWRGETISQHGAQITASPHRGVLAVCCQRVLTQNPRLCPRKKCTHEICSRQDRRGVDLISDALPIGRPWYAERSAISNAIDYAKFYSCSHDAVIHVTMKRAT
jgi:hypothetical protein